MGRVMTVDRMTESPEEKGVAISTRALPALECPLSPGALRSCSFRPLLPSSSNIATSPIANFQIGTMINDPGKNLISCPVVQD